MFEFSKALSRFIGFYQFNGWFRTSNKLVAAERTVTFFRVYYENQRTSNAGMLATDLVSWPQKMDVGLTQSPVLRLMINWPYIRMRVTTLTFNLSQHYSWSWQKKSKLTWHIIDMLAAIMIFWRPKLTRKLSNLIVSSWALNLLQVGFFLNLRVKFEIVYSSLLEQKILLFHAIYGTSPL
jgi:hypothetical protein